MHITRSACNNLFLCERKSGIFASVSSLVPDAHTCAYLLVDSPSWAHIRCRSSCSVEPAAAISQVLLTVREREREKNNNAIITRGMQIEQLYIAIAECSNHALCLAVWSPRPARTIIYSRILN
jgi:hypothetical protein